MMGEARRKVYKPDFKAKVGIEAIRGRKTTNELGQEYGVHPVQIGQWKKEIVEGASRLFEAKRGRKAKDEGSGEQRLYEEIGRLKMELDWLKKKSGLSL
jgi:transposase-like protein